MHEFMMTVHPEKEKEGDFDAIRVRPV